MPNIFTPVGNHYTRDTNTDNVALLSFNMDILIDSISKYKYLKRMKHEKATSHLKRIIMNKNIMNSKNNRVLHVLSRILIFSAIREESAMKIKTNKQKALKK
jgi:hypothetical protein